MLFKWYQSRRIQATIITGIFTISLGILTTPLWLRNSKKGESQETKQTKIELSNEKLYFDPISLKVLFDLNPNRINLILDSLRTSYQLRSIQLLESGKSIEETPSRTFFYFLASHFHYTKEFLNNVLKKNSTLRKRNDNCQFEIFKVSEKQIFIVAFVSNESASLISRLNGKERKELILSSVFWDTTSCLVLIPFERILMAKAREITTDDNKIICVLNTVIK